MIVTVQRLIKGRGERKISLSFFCLLFLGVSVPVGAQEDLSRFQDRSRVLLIFAPGASDPNWRRQNSLLANSAAPFQERDLLRFDIFERGDSRGPDGRLFRMPLLVSGNAIG